MAKKKLPRIDLTGISTRDLLTMDEERLMDLTRSQFRGMKLTKREFQQTYRRAFANITSRLVSTANKRIKRLAKTKIGRTAPAYISYKKHKKFSVRGKNYNELRNMFKLSKQFLRMKTSTIGGWEEVRKRTEELFGDMNTHEIGKFWKLYKELEETNGGFVSKGHATRLSSDEIQKMLHQEMMKGKNNNFEDVVGRMQKRIDDIYEEEQEESQYDDYFEDIDEYDEFE